MLKKSFLLVFFLIFTFLASGCTLVKGAGGAAAGLANGACEGAKEDWDFLKKADTWIKDSLW